MQNAMVYYGDSADVSVSSCERKMKELKTFFPLMVLYQEKLYAAGKIPGGFLRRR